MVWTTPDHFPGKPCGHDHRTHQDACVCAERMIERARRDTGYASGGFGYWVTSDLGLTDPESSMRWVMRDLEKGNWKDAMDGIARTMLIKWRAKNK